MGNSQSGREARNARQPQAAALSGDIGNYASLAHLTSRIPVFGRGRHLLLTNMPNLSVLSWDDRSLDSQSGGEEMSEQRNARGALRMPAWMVTGLLLAVIVFADDYPRPASFVNDFANQLPVSTVQALEKKVRDYERTIGNDIAVAVVPSLNGMLVDEYAWGLFHAWGVGKPAVNNGVLFVWAPKERRIRIELGIGLQGALTDVASGRIVTRVRDLFRRERYADGVNAAVDGITQVLGTSRAAGASAPEGLNFVERTSPQEPERQQEEDAPRAASERMRVIDFWVAALRGVGLCLIYRLRRAARWQAEVPREL